MCVVLAACVSTHAQMVSITGSVKNQDGQALSGATVLLKYAKLSAVTKSDGSYSISGNAPVVVRCASAEFVGAPIFNKGKLDFSVTRDGGRVKVALFDTRGRCLASLVDGFLGKGNYSLDAFSSRLAQGVYCIVADIEGRHSTFKAMEPFSPHMGNLQLHRSGITAAAPAKRAAEVVDSLIASDSGYATAAQGIPSEVVLVSLV